MSITIVKDSENEVRLADDVLAVLSELQYRFQLRALVCLILQSYARMLSKLWPGRNSLPGSDLRTNLSAEKSIGDAPVTAS